MTGKPSTPLMGRRITVAVLWLLACIRAALAGDFAERQILGFSPDGRYFAFEQFGRQDGSGFPYADIFVVDTGADSWVKDTPFRVLLKDERAEVSWARKEAIGQAGNLLRELVITAPGRLLASNPPGELSANPHEVRVNARFAVSGASEPWRFRLQERPFESEKCRTLLGGPVTGFSLTAQRGDGLVRELHADKGVPDSRGCPMRYALSDVVIHEPEAGGRVFAVLLSVYAYGFEGPDRRFIAVTHLAK